jgi:hypothetical protein
LLKLCDTFKGIASCSVGNGSTVKFWSEVWNGNFLEHKFSRLFFYAKKKDISVADIIHHNNSEEQFHLSLSIQAFQEYQAMQDIIQQTIISNEAKDVWSYLWWNAHYSASKFYHLPYKNVHPKALHMDLEFQLF